MMKKKFILPYPEFRLIREIKEMDNIPEIEEHITQYIQNTIKINKLVFTNELFKECEHQNKTLDDQFNYYIPYVNDKIHYFNLYLNQTINDEADRKEIIYLCSHRINLLKLRLKFIMHCQNWINTRKEIAI